MSFTLARTTTSQTAAETDDDREVAQFDYFANLSQPDLDRLTEYTSQAQEWRKRQKLNELVGVRAELDETKAERDALKAELELRIHRDAELEAGITARFAAKPVKLDVGGTIFATSLSNLIREKDTYLYELFMGGGGGHLAPSGGSAVVFIDRDPEMFGLVIDYLRRGPAAFDKLAADKLPLLKKEADFYKIASLQALLQMPHHMRTTTTCLRFLPQVRGAVTLSVNYSLAVNDEMRGGGACVLSAEPFLWPPMRSSCSEMHEMHVKILRGKSLLIGVAPRDKLNPGMSWRDCGWHLSTVSGTLYGCDGKYNAKYGKRAAILPGSTVTVRMDADCNISFLVDGQDWGVAYTGVRAANTPPLHLCVTFARTAAAGPPHHQPSSPVVMDGAVQLV